MFDFTAFIKSHREDLGLTQREAATRWNCHHMSVSKVESEDPAKYEDLKDESLSIIESEVHLKPSTLVVHKRLNAMERDNIDLNLLTDPEVLMHHNVKGYQLPDADPTAAEAHPDYKKPEDPGYKKTPISKLEHQLLLMLRESDYLNAIRHVSTMAVLSEKRQTK